MGDGVERREWLNDGYILGELEVCDWLGGSIS